MGSDRLALLIDGDNVSAKVITGVLAEVAKHGTASVRRIYGDWTQPNLGPWKKCLLEHSIQPVQQFAYTTGKNATDGAMIIDAMDLLYTGRFDGFCLISSDSDFTRLAVRIREQGLTVYGFGEGKTPRPFVSACDRFYYFHALEAVTPIVANPRPTTLHAIANLAPEPAPEPAAGAAANAGPETAAHTISDAAANAAAQAAADAAADAAERALISTTQRSHTEAVISPTIQPARSGAATGRLDAEALRILRRAVEACADDDGQANLALVGSYLTKQAPDFNAANYGFSKLRELAEASGILDVDLVRRPPSAPICMVRLSDTSHKRPRLFN
ncbi:hypothetical protein DHEL01_v213069 [Diaporthe helianthi]|uniref:HTH OST-type domain-containing protein n=1 Tax=Diaporthe helianthi TaxID=158607 RepID=A0A2P5HE64_DIAHE|nr:hypothetical protein DHEL01_v213069 [Diaporthe helianthi]